MASSNQEATFFNALLNCLPSFLAILIACFLQVFIFYLIPITAGIDISEARRKIDRPRCQCPCFDKLNKGTYGGDHYRAVYFNYDIETVYLFIITVLYVLVLKEFILRVLRLWVSGRLNLLALIVFGVNVYQLNYNWWAIWNYINESIYSLFPSQLLFTFTELIPALAVFFLLDSGINSITFKNGRTQTFKTISVPSFSNPKLQIGSLENENANTGYRSRLFSSLHSAFYQPLTSTNISWFLVICANVISISHILLSLEDQGWAHLSKLIMKSGEANSQFTSWLNKRDAMFLVGDLATALFMSSILFWTCQKNGNVLTSSSDSNFRTNLRQFIFRGMWRSLVVVHILGFLIVKSMHAVVVKRD